MEVDEEEGTVSFPASFPEWTEEDEKPKWNKSFDEWVKRYWGKYPPLHPDELEVKWKNWKEQEVEGHDGTNRRKPMSTTTPPCT